MGANYTLSNGFAVINPTFGYDAGTDARHTVTLGDDGRWEYRGNRETGRVYVRPLNIAEMEGCEPSMYGDRGYWRRGLHAWLKNRVTLTAEGRDW